MSGLWEFSLLVGGVASLAGMGQPVGGGAGFDDLPGEGQPVDDGRA